MNKQDKNKSDVWDLDNTPEVIDTVAEPAPDAKAKKTKTVVDEPVAPTIDRGFDMEGLMTDFPTAKELEQFVYNQTGIVLNLKGRANKLKYQVAMDTLNGKQPEAQYVGNENPYLDRTELIPEDPLKDIPVGPPAELKGHEVVTRFGTNVFPHPEPEWRAQDIKAQVVFRKYDNGAITYEILGPIAKRAVGTKINKFGQKQPERITWVDPRTGEQVIRRADGTYTPIGTRLRNFMQRQKVNKSNQWDTWIDREFVAADNLIIDNPWNVN